MEVLNKTYYHKVVENYKGIDILQNSFTNTLSDLSFRMIISRRRERKSIHVNFQGDNDCLVEVCEHLFIELANDIFCNSVDFPPFNAGDKVRSKKKFSVGGSKPVNLDFSVKQLSGNRFALFNAKHQISIEKTFDQLVKQFIPLSQNAHNETLAKFHSFFEKLNGKSIHDFSPAYFEKKFVFIAAKSLWDSFENKNKIPCTYYPNAREDNNSHEIKSIPALPDNIMYFTPKYEICYQKLLLQGKKIDTIIIVDVEEEKMQQILHDKNRFGFNIILITNSLNPPRYGGVPCWNWFKEEVEILNTI